jgi:hypothetical protein
MKVKDIINKLKEYDENSEIAIHIYWEDESYIDIWFNEIDFYEKIESFMIWKDWKPIWSRFDDSIKEAINNTISWEKVERRKVLVLSFDY